jgi:hypothetical protein
MLLIGDPGTGKCQKFDTKVVLGDGTERMLGELVESRLENPVAVDDGVYQSVDFPVQTVTADENITVGQATKVWKREAPDRMYRIRTESGREVEVTPSHPLFVPEDGGMDATRADELAVGDHLAARESGVTDGTTEESATPISVAPDGGSTTVDGAGGHGGIRWDRIESIETVDPDDDWVYDLEVAGTHTYLGNGIVSHNSSSCPTSAISPPDPSTPPGRARPRQASRPPPYATISAKANSGVWKPGRWCWRIKGSRLWTNSTRCVVSPAIRSSTSPTGRSVGSRNSHATPRKRGPSKNSTTDGRSETSISTRGR